MGNSTDMFGAAEPLNAQPQSQSQAQSQDAFGSAEPLHTVTAPTGTLSATPKTNVLGQVARIPTDPVGVVSDALDSVRNEIGNYTEQGRADHPILSRIGDVMDSAHDLLVGGPQLGKPTGNKSWMGSGIINNPAAIAMSAAPGGADVAASAQEKLATAIQGVREARAAKAAEATAQAAERATPLESKSLTYREATPAPQHGSPVKVASPLDRPTVDSLSGGKELSKPAFDQLQQYAQQGSKAGEEIPVGSSPKNTLHRLSEPDETDFLYHGSERVYITTSSDKDANGGL